jgi:hypothetical protein
LIDRLESIEQQVQTIQKNLNEWFIQGNDEWQLLNKFTHLNTN